MKDYYFILGISHKAESHEIKEAFRKLCLKYHPDKAVQTPHNQARYMEICEAYKVLSNKEKRARYDKKLGLTGDAKGFASIYPEIQTSYKGHYPWFAAFAVIIVGILALVFLYANDNQKTATIKPAPETKKLAITAQPKAAAPLPAPVASSVTTKDITAAVPKLDTALQKATIPDSTKKTEEKIISALKKHTPWRISKVTATSGGRVAPYEEWDYNYYFKDKKLYITYKSDEYGKVSRNRIVIPAKDVQTVYYYNNKIWINSRRKTIQAYNSFTDERINTEFFAVKVNNRSLEHDLSEAFAQLKSQY